MTMKNEDLLEQVSDAIASINTLNGKFKYRLY